MSDDCQVAFISRCIFIKAAFSNSDTLTAHSFCDIPPRHQSLLSGSPIKAEVLAGCSDPPRLYLVNGGELTPTSAEREKISGCSHPLCLSIHLHVMRLSVYCSKNTCSKPPISIYSHATTWKHPCIIWLPARNLSVHSHTHTHSLTCWAMVVIFSKVLYYLSFHQAFDIISLC